MLAGTQSWLYYSVSCNCGQWLLLYQVKKCSLSQAITKIFSPSCELLIPGKFSRTSKTHPKYSAFTVTVWVFSLVFLQHLVFPKYLSYYCKTCNCLLRVFVQIFRCPLFSSFCVISLQVFRSNGNSPYPSLSRPLRHLRLHRVIILCLYFLTEHGRFFCNPWFLLWPT